MPQPGRRPSTDKHVKQKSQTYNNERLTMNSITGKEMEFKYPQAEIFSKNDQEHAGKRQRDGYSLLQNLNDHNSTQAGLTLG